MGNLHPLQERDSKKVRSSSQDTIKPGKHHSRDRCHSRGRRESRERKREQTKLKKALVNGVGGKYEHLPDVPELNGTLQAMKGPAYPVDCDNRCTRGEHRNLRKYYTRHSTQNQRSSSAPATPDHRTPQASAERGEDASPVEEDSPAEVNPTESVQIISSSNSPGGGAPVTTDTLPSPEEPKKSTPAVPSAQSSSDTRKKDTHAPKRYPRIEAFPDPGAKTGAENLSNLVKVRPKEDDNYVLCSEPPQVGSKKPNDHVPRNEPPQIASKKPDEHVPRNGLHEIVSNWTKNPNGPAPRQKDIILPDDLLEELGLKGNGKYVVPRDISSILPAREPDHIALKEAQKDVLPSIVQFLAKQWSRENGKAKQQEASIHDLEGRNKQMQDFLYEIHEGIVYCQRKCEALVETHGEGERGEIVIQLRLLEALTDKIKSRLPSRKDKQSPKVVGSAKNWDEAIAQLNKFVQEHNSVLASESLGARVLNILQEMYSSIEEVDKAFTAVNSGLQRITEAAELATPPPRYRSKFFSKI
ncbi:hypothetical protein F4777DRAFT_592867 [Nemania sp. FL0916]|nr:hypothetical protein F4777DRAFT_592867 [Nemania sp. FL0916]